MHAAGLSCGASTSTWWRSCRHAAEAIRLSAEQRGQQLDLVLPDEQLYLSADSSRLEQVVTNLLVNSVKYTPGGGRIRCTVERRDGQAILRVSDNGIGVAPELLPHIFDMFMCAEQAVRQSEGGLGLGLTLVRNLVELHGGSIRASSKGPNQGAEFVVELPLTVADLKPLDEQTATQQPASLVPRAGGRRQSGRSAHAGGARASRRT